MPKEYLVLIGAVFGGVITLLVTGINLYFNNRKHKTEYIRDKIEEIHLIIHEIFDFLEAGIQNPNATFPPNMHAGKRSEEDKLKSEYKKSLDLKKERLEMLVNFYCDNLLIQSNEYIDKCENYHKKYIEITTSEDVEEAMELQKELKTKRDFLLRSVYAEARKNY
ncbi:hypothetical protein ACFQ9Y_16960 [Peribacillus simplex]|uniref:hypothetical protein n=1 Tax=Peribacillus simplex TaxID=1478 RepID=UPI00366F93DB